MLRPLRRLLPRACLLPALLLQVPGGQAVAAEEPVLHIVAQARLAYTDFGGSVTEQNSNAVRASTPAASPSLAFFTDNQYSQRAWTTRTGRTLFPQIVASACNLDPLQRDTLTVTLRSAKAGALGDFDAIETGPNTGVFRLRASVASRAWAAANAATANTQDVLPGDIIEASATSCGAGGGTVTTEIRIDPRGVVFDASTGLPQPGASVSLIDVTGQGNGGNAGGPAAVFTGDGATPAPSTVVTDADGSYSFPQMRPSQYRLRVQPVATYTFPSSWTVAQLGSMATDYNLHAGASYGASFTVDGSGAMALDVPIDPLPKALQLQKTASRGNAEIAETVAYSVVVKNVGQVDLSGVTVQDTLPVGFSYVPGSVRLDGTGTTEPTGSRGPHLDFTITPVLPVSGSHTLSYRVLVGPGALQGDGINRAVAVAAGPVAVRSNVGSVRVKVEAGVFSDQAIVLGTVYADCNANGLQDAGEPGVPGVRLLMEDGSSVTTDGAGRYSLYGLSPRTHVLKLDAITLPAGAEPEAFSQRHAGDGRSRFVDVQRGELHRADFALAGCTAALHTEIEQRRRGLPDGRELGAALRTALQPGASAAPTDLRALPAAGVVGDSAGLSAAAQGPAAPAAAVAPDAPTLPGFLDLQDGQVVPAVLPALTVQGRLGAVLGLQANGRAVGDDHIGERAQSADAQTEQLTYIGLALQPGDNTLTVTEHDAFGHLRASHSVRVRVAGALARIVVDAPARADAGTPVAVTIALQDAHGLPVRSRLPVTLSASAGEWDVRDLDPQAPGVQTFIEGGSARFMLRAPATPGDVQLQAATGGTSGSARIGFVPTLRPLTAAGIVEGAINLRNLARGSVVPADRRDGFEDQLRSFAGRGDGSNAGAGGRAALFLKGKVRGDALLTLSYDSDKSTREALFRDIQPDAFYPVYGDSSVKAFDAQSTGKLYVRIDKNKSSLLYGDFTTQAVNPVRQLGAYQRSLNGVQQHVELGGLVANAFAAHDNTRQLVQELRGDGTSGPYTLAANAVANSEKVELLVRDRNQPALVLSSTPQGRFSDYDFEPLTGRLLFRAPVPSLDSHLNPVSIRITYEVEQGGPAFWVAGGDAQWQATPRLNIGGAVAKDQNPMAPTQLVSANASAKLAAHTVLSAEVARVQHDEASNGTAASAGNAERVELQHDGQALKGRAYAARSDVGFDNRSATLNSGRSEAGAKAAYTLDDRTRLTAEALHTADITSHARRDGALLGVERSFAHGVKAEVGVRHVQEQTAATAGSDEAATQTTSVRTKLGATVPGLPMASVFAEAEQDVRDSDKRLLAVGGDYQVAQRGRVYARHELISSLTGPYNLDPAQRRNTTVVGLDAGTGGVGNIVGGEGRVFSEYRGREAFNGRETEAAIGLRNQWQLKPGLRLNGSLERVQALSGSNNSQSAAVTGAVEYTADPLWKGTARLELREGAGSTSALSTLGLAAKLNQEWTFLGKNVLAVTQGHGAQPSRLQERLQLGMAYRDAANRVNGLGRYEFKQERGGLVDADMRRVHTLSSHVEGQPQRRLSLSGHYAVKWVNEAVNQASSAAPARAIAQLASGRAMYDLGSRWDAGVAASVLANARFSSRQMAVGAEAGYRLQENLWVSAGYNLTGFKDRDLSAENATARGIYLRLRFKFDENLFSRAKT